MNVAGAVAVAACGWPSVICVTSGPVGAADTVIVTQLQLVDRLIEAGGTTNVAVDVVGDGMGAGGVDITIDDTGVAVGKVDVGMDAGVDAGVDAGEDAGEDFGVFGDETGDDASGEDAEKTAGDDDTMEATVVVLTIIGGADGKEVGLVVVARCSEQ